MWHRKANRLLAVQYKWRIIFLLSKIHKLNHIHYSSHTHTYICILLPRKGTHNIEKRVQCKKCNKYTAYYYDASTRMSIERQPRRCRVSEIVNVPCRHIMYYERNIRRVECDDDDHLAKIGFWNDNEKMTHMLAIFDFRQY